MNVVLLVIFCIVATSFVFILLFAMTRCRHQYECHRAYRIQGTNRRAYVYICRKCGKIKTEIEETC